MSTPKDPSYDKNRPFRFISFEDEYEVVRPSGEVRPSRDMSAERAALGLPDSYDKSVQELGFDPTDPMPRLPSLAASAALDRQGYPEDAHHRMGRPDLGEKICVNCAYYELDRCEMYSRPTMPDDTCDSWADHR